MLDSSAVNEIVSLLEPEMRDERTRRSLLDVLFVGAASRPDIDPAGASLDATRRIVLALVEFGEIQPGQPALWALCEIVMPQIGLDRQARLQALREAIFAPPDVPVTLEEAPRHHMAFVSYARGDRDFVQKLSDDLQAQGVPVWVDRSGLEPGTSNWENALRGAIRDAYAVLLVASPDARQSNYVQAELAIAEMYGCPVIPVWARGEHWIDAVPMEMAKAQYVDLRANDSYAANLSAVAGRLKELHAKATSEQPAVTKTPFLSINPYKGLRPFTDDDARYFFGRERLVEELVAALSERDVAGERFLAVIGASGSGKSSVVMAGLLPRLRERHESEKWVYLPPLVPGTRPLEALANLLAEALGLSARTVREDLDNADGRGLHLLIERIAQREKAVRVVLYIDQFEEIFTLTESEEERRQVIDLLVKAASEARGVATIILTLRADFYDRPMQYPALGKLLEARSKSVLPMDVSDLRAAIEKPAALVGLGFEDGLVGDLLFEVRDQPGALPLLQFTLDQLYRHCVIQDGGERLVMSAYREIGGVRGALAKHAEATYAQLPDDEYRRLARGLFLNLIEPGANEQDTTRRRAPATDLVLADVAQTAMLAAVAEAFTQARLLVTSRVGDIEMIEVSHEALIREWVRLRDWLKDARLDLDVLRSLRDDTRGWIERGRQADDPGLLRGSVLRESQSWAARNTPSADQAAFIAASAAYEANLIALEEQRKQELIEAEQRALAASEEATRTAKEAEAATATAKRQRTLARIAMVGALLLGVVAVFAGVNAFSTVQNANATLLPLSFEIAAANGQLLAAQVQATQVAGDVMNSRALFAANLSSQQLAGGSPQNALLLALESLKDYPTVYNVESQQALSNALQSPVQEINYFSHDAPITGARWSEDETRLLTWSTDGTARVWTMDGSREPIVLRHGASVMDAHWSKDERHVLTCSSDGAVRIWTLDQPSEPLSFNNSSPCRGAAWNPDETRVLSWDALGILFVWNPDDPHNPIIRDTMYMVNDAAWSPDGRRVLYATRDVNVDVWDVGSSAEPRRLVHDGYVMGATWSANSKRILTWANDGRVRVWTADGSSAPVSYQTGENVNGATWSADETRVLIWTEAMDAYNNFVGTVEVWTIDGSAEPLVAHYSSWVRGAVWSRDESRILFWLIDGTARVWSTESSAEPLVFNHNVVVNEAAWSPDETHILTRTDETVQMWRVETGSVPLVMRPKGPPAGATLSGDGERVLTWDAAGAAQVWRTSGSVDPVRFQPPGGITHMEQSADGKRLLTTEVFESTVYLWTLDNSLPPLVLEQDGAVAGAAWNKDATRVLSWADDGTVRIWSASDGEELSRLEYDDAVMGAVWNADETRILSWAVDGKVRVQTADGSAPPVEVEQGGTIIGARWSRNETRVLSWSDNGTVQVWTPDGSSPTITLRGDHAITRAAWSPDETHVLAWMSYLDNSSNAVSVWALDDGKLTLLEHDDIVNGARWSSDGQRILSWSEDGTARVWMLDGSAEPILLKSGAAVRSAVWSADGKRVLTASLDGTARIWTLDGSAEPIVLDAQTQLTRALWNPDETRVLVVLASYGAAEVWNPDDGRIQILGSSDRAYSNTSDAQWDADGDHILVWKAYDGVEIWAATIPGLIDLGQKQLIRDLDNPEREGFFLPTLMPTATTSVPTITPLPSVTPIRTDTPG